MTKPNYRDGYSDELTTNCERVLVTLLNGLGPWKESVCLVGGLVPRYLVPDRPPVVPPHAGTNDVDIAVELEVLSDTNAYASLEENLRKMGFSPWTNPKGNSVLWRWKKVTDDGETILIEFLADHPKKRGGKVSELPTEGRVAALNIPHSSIVFDMHDSKNITAELYHGDGHATENIRYANLVAFVCLKALAMDQRAERKDAHDLVYCVEYAPGGITTAAELINAALKGKHRAIVRRSLTILSKKFIGDGSVEPHMMNGPVAVAKFELGEDPALAESRILRQREVSVLIGDLLAATLGVE
tara:strand:- start:16570 stop:17469 length:900 start_codon:yes stop_codon:yes gene_type:complete